MFYRFNAHRQGRGSGRQSQHRDAGMDHAARRIASGIIKVQRRWAALMSGWVAKLPGKWLRILMIVSFAAASYFFLGLIVPRLSWQGDQGQQLLSLDGWSKAGKPGALSGRTDSLKVRLDQSQDRAGKH